MEPEPRGAALDYARRGWSVVPVHGVISGRCACGAAACPSPGKHPRVRWEPFQHEPAPLEQVQAWWNRWPTANVGIVTGSVSGILVLDVDPRHGGDRSLADGTARWGALPVTPEVRTGGDGVHFYLAMPGRPVASGHAMSGLDLRADGGLVVAPPSVHVSGGAYRWVDGRGVDDVALGAVPAWVLDRVGASAEEARGADGLTPPRTAAQRREFAELWRAVGVEIAPGDRYYLCPFHDDHHPSLHVDAEGCRWYCFACGEGGGPAALRRRIERAGVAVPAHPEPARRPESPERAPGVRSPRATTTVPATWMQWPTLQPGGRQEVVGESEHQDALEEVAGGRTWGGPAIPIVTAALRREAGDLEVPESVRVEVGGSTVGWIPRADATRFAAAVARLERTGVPATARAWITGGWDRGPQGRGWFGIELDVDPALVPRDPDGAFLPPGPPVAVVGEEHHQPELRRITGTGHGAQVTATLDVDPEADPPAVRVRIGDDVVGRLGAASSRRFWPLVEAVVAKGFPATCTATVIEGATKLEVYVLLPRPDLADVG